MASCRYLLASTVIGLAYTLLQIAFGIFQVSTGNRLAGDGMLLFDFYADKVWLHFFVNNQN